MEPLIFEHALVAPNGHYYTGKAGAGMLSPNINDAYTYTKKGAEYKINNTQWAKSYTIEHRV